MFRGPVRNRRIVGDIALGPALGRDQQGLSRTRRESQGAPSSPAPPQAGLPAP